MGAKSGSSNRTIAKREREERIWRERERRSPKLASRLMLRLAVRPEREGGGKHQIEQFFPRRLFWPKKKKKPASAAAGEGGHPSGQKGMRSSAPFQRHTQDDVDVDVQIVFVAAIVVALSLYPAKQLHMAFLQLLVLPLPYIVLFVVAFFSHPPASPSCYPIRCCCVGGFVVVVVFGCKGGNCEAVEKGIRASLCPQPRSPRKCILNS